MTRTARCKNEGMNIFFQENFDIENILWIVGCRNENLVEFCTVGHHIRALVSARGSEQKRKKQKQSPRLKSRLPVPLYVFMTKTENRNFQGLVK